LSDLVEASEVFYFCYFVIWAMDKAEKNNFTYYNEPSSENFRLRRLTKSRLSVILIVVYHRQNPLEVSKLHSGALDADNYDDILPVMTLYNRRSRAILYENLTHIPSYILDVILSKPV
jgi:hypothetical protein